MWSPGEFIGVKIVVSQGVKVMAEYVVKKRLLCHQTVAWGFQWVSSCLDVCDRQQLGPQGKGAQTQLGHDQQFELVTFNA